MRLMKDIVGKHLPCCFTFDVCPTTRRPLSCLELERRRRLSIKQTLLRPPLAEEDAMSSAPAVLTSPWLRDEDVNVDDVVTHGRGRWDTCVDERVPRRREIGRQDVPEHFY